MCSNIDMGPRKVSETTWLSQRPEERAVMTMTDVVSPLGAQQSEEGTDPVLGT